VVTELRRGPQRRSAPRATSSELILVSDGMDVDAQLVDVSASGVGFLLDRPLPIHTNLQMLINLERQVITATVQIRYVNHVADAAYRIGASFTTITPNGRDQLARYAARHTTDRRINHIDPSSLRFRIVSGPR
jgi:c-di-GMP-binding flagellar brake protein YcgR